MMHISYIPRPRLVLTRAAGDVIQCEIDQRPGIQLSASKTITIIQQDGSSLTRTQLTIGTNGQTQFNIFAQPPAQHWLIVNGIEEYHTKAYEIQQVGPNWRVVWLNTNYQLTTDMELIFVTKTT